MASGTTEQARLARLRRVVPVAAGAAVTGALVGGAMLGIWDATARAGASNCASQGSVICGLGEAAAGYLDGLATVVAGTLLAFVFLRIRPPLPSVLGAALLAGLLLVGVDRAVPGGRPSGDWVLVPLLAIGYALLAIAVTVPGWPRLTAGVLLAAMVVAAFTAAPLVRSAAQTRQQQQASLALAAVPADAVLRAWTQGHGHLPSGQRPRGRPEPAVGR